MVEDCGGSTGDVWDALILDPSVLCETQVWWYGDGPTRHCRNNNKNNNKGDDDGKGDDGDDDNGGDGDC